MLEGCCLSASIGPEKPNDDSPPCPSFQLHVVHDTAPRYDLLRSTAMELQQYQSITSSFLELGAASQCAKPFSESNDGSYQPLNKKVNLGRVWWPSRSRHRASSDFRHSSRFPVAANVFAMVCGRFGRRLVRQLRRGSLPQTADDLAGRQPRRCTLCAARRLAEGRA